MQMEKLWKQFNLPGKTRFLPLESLIALADPTTRSVTVRAVNALRRNRMRTVGDLLERSIPELKAVPHIDSTMANKLVELLVLLTVKHADLVPRYKKEMILHEMRSKRYIT